MKKTILISCLLLALTACGIPPSIEDVDWQQVSGTAVSASGTTVLENKRKPKETAPPETPAPETTVKPEEPKLSDEEIGAFDNTMVPYGQGVQVDDMNRPLGALDFQDKYGGHGANAIMDTEKTIYLTFDQGYENGFTPAILDALKEKGVKATFFLTGDYVRTVDPALIQRMIDEGHTLGNHGDKHKSLPEELLPQSIALAEKELQDCYSLVLEKFGYEMKCSRPPKGEFSERSLEVTKRLGYTTYLWSFAYKDWETNAQPDPEEAYARIMKFAHGGEIMLLHSVSSTNASILGRVIDDLMAEGYTFAAL